MTKFVSIVIPFYNVEKYIGECIESCLAQNFDHEQYEIVCINDGSTDSSKDIIENMQLYNDNIVLIDQNHKGVSAARNSGIAISKGEYIWFVDADDLIQENSISKLFEVSQQGDFDKISFAHYEFEEKLTDRDIQEIQSKQLKANATPPGWLIVESLFSRQFIQQNCLQFSPQISYGEDGLFSFEFNYYHPKSVTIDDVLYYYRRNPTSLTRTRSVEANKAQKDSRYQIAKVMTVYAEKEKNATANDSLQIKAATLMPMVREITISAAGLPRDQRHEILKTLSENDLFPILLCEKFPQKIHMYHSYMGFKGKLLDILNFYSTTRCGFIMLTSFNYLYKKLRP